MTHWSRRGGWGLLIASYLAQSVMILWGPPPVKAFGLAWAATPGLDPLTFGLGAALPSGIGHPDVPRPPVFQIAADAHRKTAAEFCDPKDPLWWC